MTASQALTCVVLGGFAGGLVLLLWGVLGVICDALFNGRLCHPSLRGDHEQDTTDTTTR
jgi:hypothetical protein